MREFYTDPEAAAGHALYDQAFAYFREHSEEQKEVLARLLDAADVFLQFYVDAGLEPGDAMGEMMRYLIQHYSRGSNLREEA
jgi:hypothetical protein